MSLGDWAHPVLLWSMKFCFRGLRYLGREEETGEKGREKKGEGERERREREREQEQSRSIERKFSSLTSLPNLKMFCSQPLI